MKFRRVGVIALSAALACAAGALVACGDDDDDAPEEGPAPTQANAGGIPSNLTKVTVSDNKFTPASLQVPVGANITWEWTGSNPHSIKGTFDGKAIESPRLTGTGTYQEAFQKAGTFEYQCGVHGEAMKGTITVR